MKWNLDDITPSSSLGFSIFLLAKLKIFANPQCLVVPEKEVKSYAMTLESLESLEEVDHFIFGWRTERVKLKSSRYGYVFFNWREVTLTSKMRLSTNLNGVLLVSSNGRWVPPKWLLKEPCFIPQKDDYVLTRPGPSSFYGWFRFQSITTSCGPYFVALMPWFSWGSPRVSWSHPLDRTLVHKAAKNGLRNT